MKLLLDTHVLLWWLDDSGRLPLAMLEFIADPVRTVFLSAASALEIRIKQKLGKLELPADFDEAVEGTEFQ